MRRILTACALAGLTACTQQAQKAEDAKAPAAAQTPAGPIKPAATEAPGGVYSLDASHTDVSFRVNHIGLSQYTARFKDVDAQLKLDTANPAASSVTASIDPSSLELPAPPAGFDAEIKGPQWLDAGKFPKITFQSTKVELTGPNTARITGDLSLHGLTKPVVLEATFNGGYPAGGMDPSGARVGFSAHGSFKRSDFGVSYGVPAPGSNMGVGDLVEVTIETEFTQPGAAAKPAG